MQTNNLTDLFTVLLETRDYVFWKNARYEYLGCNARFAALVGLGSPAEIVGKTDFDLPWQVQGDSATCFRQGDQAVLDGKRLRDRLEKLALPGRETLIVRVTKRPLRNAQGTIDRIVGIVDDITVEKQLEDQLKLSQAQANLARDAKRLLIANLSHNLVTPFTAIIGLTQQVADELEDPVKRDLLQESLTASAILLQRLRQLFALVETTVGNPSTVTATFSPQTILDQSVGLLRPALRQKGISFNTHCPGSLPEALVGDPIRLQNVILSLLTNAIDSTEAGRITLAVSSEVISDRAWLTLTVTDTGCGIPADKLPTLFDAFTRVTPAYTSPTGGMGLSLTLTKAYLDRIGGTINVTSEVGKGSTVTVKAPFAVSSDAPPVPNAAAATPPKMPPAQSRLLLVEDELITQEVLRGQFTRLGCEVTLAETVADALAAVREQDYDWVLTDIGLPDGDGIGLTRTLRADPRCQALPIIGHSAHIDAAGQQEALEAGMQEIHQKPLPEAERARLVAQYGGGRMTLSGDKR